MSTVKSVRFDDNIVEISERVLDLINHGWIPSPKISFSSLLNEGLETALWNKIRGYLPYCDGIRPRKFPVVDNNGNIRLIEPSKEEKNKVWDIATELLKLQIPEEEYYEHPTETPYEEYIDQLLGNIFVDECSKYDEVYPSDDDVVDDYLAMRSVIRDE